MGRTTHAYRTSRGPDHEVGIDLPPPAPVCRSRVHDPSDEEAAYFRIPGRFSRGLGWYLRLFAGHPADEVTVESLGLLYTPDLAEMAATPDPTQIARRLARVLLSHPL